MVWNEMTHILIDNSYRVIKKEKKEFIINVVSYDFKICQALCPDTLYFSKYSGIKQSSLPDFPVSCLMVFPDEPIPETETWDAFFNVAIVEDETVFFQLIRKTEALRQELLEINEQLHHLFSMTMNGASLQQLVNKVAEIYHHATAIQTNSLTMTTFCENITPPEKQMLSNYSVSSVVTHFRNNGVLSTLEHSKWIIPIRDDTINVYSFTAPIYVSSTVRVGYLSIFLRKNETISPALTFTLAYAARIIGVSMQDTYMIPADKSSHITNILLDLKNGVITSESYKERCTIFGYSLKKWKNIIIIDLHTHYASSSYAYTIAHSVEKLLPNSIYAIHEGYIYFLTSRANYEKSIDILTELQIYLASNNLNAGISSTFEEITNASHFFNEANNALQIGIRTSKGQFLYNFENYRTQYIADSIYRNNDCSSFYFPPLIKLIKLDHSTSNEAYTLTKTLKCFVDHNYSILNTSKKLFIHRNSLYYRLEKIKNIMCCDIQDAKTSWHIMLTFALLEAAGQKFDYETL